MIDEAGVKKYISIIKELKANFVFYDSHAHPFDIIFDQVDYHKDKTKNGLFSTNGCDFISPKLTSLAIGQKDSDDNNADQTLQSKISLMLIRRLYSHIGSCVFSKHMDLCGIDKSLLLPVAPASGLVENQMRSMAKLYGTDNRFEAGTSIPNSIRNADIYQFIDEMINLYNVKAVKIHPNVTEINMATPQGKQRLHVVLSACGELGIPLIVHGGRSKILKNIRASEYGCIDNLKDVDWSLCKSTVVIAHAGGHSCTVNEIKRDVIPNLKKMLRAHDHLMVDIAALNIHALNTVFQEIETDRILFGTDALYKPQWFSVVKVMHTLTKLFSKVNEKFIQIASINPSKYIFKGEVRC